VRAGKVLAKTSLSPAPPGLSFTVQDTAAAK
jgi:hypothetical protein